MQAAHGEKKVRLGLVRENSGGSRTFLQQLYFHCVFHCFDCIYQTQPEGGVLPISRSRLVDVIGAYFEDNQIAKALQLSLESALRACLERVEITKRFSCRSKTLFEIASSMQISQTASAVA